MMRFCTCPKCFIESCLSSRQQHGKSNFPIVRNNQKEFTNTREISSFQQSWAFTVWPQLKSVRTNIRIAPMRAGRKHSKKNKTEE